MGESAWRTIPWLKILRVLGVCCGLVIIAMGVYQLVVEDPEFKPIVANLYRIIFGFLIVLAELQWVKLLDWFSFLCTLIGLGGFYIFVGCLALGTQWWAITLGQQDDDKREDTQGE
jgi:nitrogen fixation-related uncharacterized protein